MRFFNKILTGCRVIFVVMLLYCENFVKLIVLLLVIQFCIPIGG